jgi:hypothetical protein
MWVGTPPKTTIEVTRCFQPAAEDVERYATKYERQMYVLYDLFSIRDEAEFKKDIESTPGVSVVIVKH